MNKDLKFLTGKKAQKRPESVRNLHMWEEGAITDAKHSYKTCHDLREVTNSAVVNNRMSHEKGPQSHVGYSQQRPPLSELVTCRKQMCTECVCIQMIALERVKVI